MVRVPWKAQAMGKRTSAIVEHVDLCLLLTNTCNIPCVRQSISQWVHAMNDFDFVP